LVQERSQLFSSVAVPWRSLVPGRGAAHMASKVLEGWKTPDCQVVVLPPLPPLPNPPPPPPQAARIPDKGNSKTLNL
jgi:hypothetical protein